MQGRVMGPRQVIGSLLPIVHLKGGRVKLFVARPTGPRE